MQNLTDFTFLITIINFIVKTKIVRKKQSIRVKYFLIEKKNLTQRNKSLKVFILILTYIKKMFLKNIRFCDCTLQVMVIHSFNM